MNRLAIILLLVAACSRAKAPKLDGDGAHLAPPIGSEAETFTARFVSRARRDHPEAAIEIAGEMSVRVKGGAPLDLRNLWAECTTPLVCDAATARWERVLFKTDENVPVKVENLRLAVFPLDDTLRSRPLAYRPFAGPLVEAIVIDTEDTISTARHEDINALGIDEDAAFKRALDNLARAFPAPISGKPLDEKNAPAVQVGYFPDSYGAARLLLHERWASLAAKGPLYAAGPARDVVIWAAAPSRSEKLALYWLAQQMAQHEPHPISPAIFRWTKQAWVLEDANDKPIQR